jgi:enoyl-CoA hydratase/carnithine racemase
VTKSSNLVAMSKHGRVAEITIDHPPMNAISVEILEALAELIAACEQDHSIRSILLNTAHGKPPFAADGAALLADTSWDGQSRMIERGKQALTAIEFCTKPVVMAIYDGVCMGGGLELALSCHIRVVGQGTIFSVPEALAGAMPGWGNTQRLVHYFGRAKAIELMLTGAQVTANEALALRAVNHVVAGSEVYAKTCEIADAIARMRTKSIIATMHAVHVPYRNGLAEGKAVEFERYMGIYDPKTFAAAVTALFEQRTMEFTD